MTKSKMQIDWLNHGLEFIVVIVGILIAFQLNTCSSENRQRKTVETHLEQIRKETELNKKFLESSVKYAEANTLKLDTIFLLLDAKKDLEKVNSLSLDLLNLGGSYIRKNAYKNLIESGDIRFIDEFKVKQRIINLYEYYKWVELFDEISLDLHQQDYYPYLRNNFDLVSGQRQDGKIYQTKLLKGQTKIESKNIRIVSKKWINF